VILCAAMYLLTLSILSGGIVTESTATRPPYLATASSRMAENAAQCGQVSLHNFDYQNLAAIILRIVLLETRIGKRESRRSPVRQFAGGKQGHSG